MRESIEMRIARRRAEVKYRFLIHVLIFILVNAFILLRKISMGAPASTMAWPLTGWGIGLMFHGLHVMTNCGKYSLMDWLLRRELRSVHPKQ